MLARRRLSGRFTTSSLPGGTGLYAGIDTHKDTLAVAVIDHHGRPLAIDEVANTERGFTELTQLQGRLPAHRTSPLARRVTPSVTQR